jgi:hypothetical protein
MTTQPQQGDNLLRELESGEYNRRYDAHRPKFKGIPEGYYPNSWGNVLIIWLSIILIYGICTGIFALFLWLLLSNPVTVTWVFFGCFIGYVLLIIGLILIGTMNRKRLEREYIEKALKTNADAEAQQTPQNNQA